MPQLMLPETDRFDPFRGYEAEIKSLGHEAWFGLVPTATLARNAFYQGFITEWEYRWIISGKGNFHEDGTLRWIADLPGKPKGPYPVQELTRERIERIRSDQLLGIGDGETSL